MKTRKQQEFWIIADLTDKIVGLACNRHSDEVFRYFDSRYPSQLIHSSDVKNIRTSLIYCAQCGEVVR